MNNFRLDSQTVTTILASGLVGAGLAYLIGNHVSDKSSVSSTSNKTKSINKASDSKPTKTLRVCVTGAAGQIGYSFIPLLANGSVFGDNVKIQLRLLDIPTAVKTLEGVALELEDGAYPLLEDVKYSDDPREAFAGCDVVVFIGGFPRLKGMERKELLAKNGHIFITQGKALDEVAKKDVKCVVVANPANTNCLLLQRNAPSIPKENFTCLTRLDQNRAVAQLAGKTGAPVTDINNVIIWGNHSTTQYPDVNHATVGSLTVRNTINNDVYLNMDFIARVQKRGAEVLQARGGSSVFSAANAVKDHLKDWYFGTKPGTYVSMGVVSDGSYETTEGLVFSFPVTCSNFTYKIVKDFVLDAFSKEKMRLTNQELVEERNEATSVLASED